jgi:hypothetical protein
MAASTIAGLRTLPSHSDGNGEPHSDDGPLSGGAPRQEEAAVRSAFRDANESRDYNTPRLPEAVTALAIAARTTGMPPERLLVLLKDIVADRQLLTVSPWWRGILTDRVVRWGIEAYYGVKLGQPLARGPDDRDDS